MVLTHYARLLYKVTLEIHYMNPQPCMKADADQLKDENKATVLL